MHVRVYIIYENQCLTFSDEYEWVLDVISGTVVSVNKHFQKEPPENLLACVTLIRYYNIDRHILGELLSSSVQSRQISNVEYSGNTGRN